MIFVQLNKFNIINGTFLESLEQNLVPDVFLFSKILFYKKILKKI